MSHTFRQISPTDHFGWHASYLEFYHRLFASLVDRDGFLLEIGTDGGGGLQMYAAYFPRYKVLGIDINPRPSSLDDSGIVHLQRNAYEQEQINELAWGPRFDVIIDDGPHSIESQEWFTENYPQLLAADGIAIIEDIQQPDYIQRLGACVPEGFIGYGIDLRHVNGRYDDLLFVIHRK